MNGRKEIEIKRCKEVLGNRQRTRQEDLVGRDEGCMQATELVCDVRVRQVGTERVRLLEMNVA